MPIVTRKDRVKGKYKVRYRTPDGTYRYKSFDRRKDAVAFDAEQAVNVKRRQWVDPRDGETTVAELVQAHVDAATNKRTRQVRKFCLDNLGPLADVPIGVLKPSQIKAWMRSLAKGREWAGGKKLSPASVRQALATLKAALNEAVADEMLVKSPAAHVSAPRVDAEVVDGASLITWEQIGDIRKACSPSASVAVLIAATTGLRAGEVAGLRVESVDFLRRTVRVTHQSLGKAKPWVWEPVKTARSRRTVPVPSEVLEIVAGHLATRESDLGDPLLLTRTGGQWSSVTLGEAFSNAADKAGVEGATFHDLRHFYASALISAGVSVQGVADMLGHESSVTTLRIYSHLFPGDVDRARDAIREFFVPKVCPGEDAGSAG